VPCAFDWHFQASKEVVREGRVDPESELSMQSVNDCHQRIHNHKFLFSVFNCISAQHSLVCSGLLFTVLSTAATHDANMEVYRRSHPPQINNLAVNLEKQQ
jgi:ribosomal protein L31